MKGDENIWNWNDDVAVKLMKDIYWIHIIYMWWWWTPPESKVFLEKNLKY